MRPLPADQWTGAAENVIFAEIDISTAEISALGGSIERSDSQLGPTEAAVFGLDTGDVVLLYRTERNPIPGYTLILQGSRHSGVLQQFLQEARLGQERVATEHHP